MRSALAALLLLAPLACGDKTASKEASDTAGEAEPAAPAIDLAIERVDERRFVVPADALMAIAAAATAGKIEVTLADGALTLTSLPPGGALAQLGLAAGDRITGVDGAPLPDLGALRDRYRRSLDSGRLDLVVVRGNEELRLSYHWREALGPDDPREPSDADRRLFAALETGVRRVEPNLFEVDELVVKALADDRDLASSGARNVTSGSGAAVNRAPGSLAALGLTPYDVIKTVDDRDVRGRHSLAGALAGIGDNRSFSLSVIRLGEPTVVRYRIVSDLVMDAELDQALAAWRAAEADRPRTRRSRPSRRTAKQDGIEQQGDDHWTVDRSVVEEALSGSRRLARAIPNVKNGEPHGLKLYGIRRSGLLGAAGIRNGDNIVSVDGRPVNSVDDLRALADRLDRPGEIAVDLVRRGKPMTLRYTIR